jgi:hypothetical protein
MTTVEKKNTNYVVVVDYKEGQTLEDCYLLGWSNKYDWFDCDTCGDEILTSTGRVKKNKYGLIEIKLGGDKLIEEGAKSLKTMEAKIDTDKMNAPSFLRVLTGTGDYAYQRPDGVFVVPVGCLKH